MFIEKKLTMADILKSADFQDAKLVAGKDGLSNEVTWVHVLEIWEDGDLWIDGGELILCGAVGVTDPKLLVQFYQKLLKKGIAGFCLELGRYIEDVPEGMIDLANAYDSPLLVFRHLVRFIDLSRNTIKTLLEFVNQNYLSEKQALDRNSWMIDWLNGTISEERIYELLKKKKSELYNNHFFVTTIEYSKSVISYHWSDSVYLTISNNLRTIFEQNQFLFYPLFANGLLTAVVIDFGKSETWKQRFNDIADIVHHHFRFQEGKPKLIMTAGCRSGQIRDVCRSYQTARDTLKLCQQMRTDCGIYEDINLYFLLSLADDSEKIERLKGFVLDQIKPLLTFDVAHNGKLIPTLRKYYQCNCGKKQTALALNITRQSLYYRLEQIEQLLGTDLLRAERRLTLEICFFFYQYLFNEDGAASD